MAAVACDNFESAKPGMAWGGMPCKNCEAKKKDHAEPVVSGNPGSATGGARADNSWIRKQQEKEQAKKKPVNIHAGTHEGSLAHFVGKALGVQHVGKSTGLMKKASQADSGTVQYHSNRAAAKEMSKTFGEMFMAASLIDSPNGRDGKSVMRASEVAKKQRELQDKKRSSQTRSSADEAASPRAAPPVREEEEKSESASPSAASSPKPAEEASPSPAEASAAAATPAEEKPAEAVPASGGCKFESDKPGMEWGGSVCKHCGQKKKDHA